MAAITTKLSLVFIVIITKCVNGSHIDFSDCFRFKTPKLRSACVQIKNDPNLAGISKGDPRLDTRISQSKLPSYMRITKKRNISRNEPGILRQLSTYKLSCQSYTECPAAYTSTPPSRSLRTTAPWDYCEDYDPLRYPQIMTVAVKACQHQCINPDTNKGSRNGYPKYVSINVPVLKAYTPIPTLQSCDDDACELVYMKRNIASYCEIIY